MSFEVELELVVNMLECRRDTLRGVSPTRLNASGSIGDDPRGNVVDLQTDRKTDRQEPLAAQENPTQVLALLF